MTQETRLRIATLNALVELPEQKGAQRADFTHRLPASWKSGGTTALWRIFSGPAMPPRVRPPRAENAFKSIPTEPASLTFVEEIK
jgi:hypothetical protein